MQNCRIAFVSKSLTDRRERVPSVTFDYHPDDYYFHRKWADDHDHHWCDYHEGRGYWRNGV